MGFSRFLVTGGGGFIGSHLVEKLQEEGAEKVVVVDNFFLGRPENLRNARRSYGRDVVVYREDARYLTALENIIDKEKVDVVYNLAVKPLPYTFIDPEGAFMTGVEIAHNLASLLRRKFYKKLIHFSSSEVYGDASYVPMDERHPLNPTSPYGAGKAAADVLLQSYHRTFSLDILIVRPFNTYGPRQNPKAYAAVIPATIRRVLKDQKPVVEWDGEQTRDFTYVKDVVDAAFKFIDVEEAVGEAINIGQGRETTIKDVIGEICVVMNYTGKFEYAPKRPADIKRHLADTSLAKKLINYEPKVSLTEGIRLTVDWFREEISSFED